MREIKFRGRDAKTGEVVYGSFCRPDGIIPDWNPNIEHGVEPDSVAQLVYVKDGKEYYEGDELEKDGRRWKCRLVMHWEEVTP